MKHLLALMALCVAFAGGAQAPYNPDSDGDSLIGSADLLNLLPLYGEGFYVDTDPVIDTLDWTDAVDDTLQLSAEADIVFLHGGGWTDDELADVCSGATRYFSVSEINPIYKRYMLVFDEYPSQGYGFECVNDSIQTIATGWTDWPKISFLYRINGLWIWR